jgi:hypothetical protein
MHRHDEKIIFKDKRMAPCDTRKLTGITRACKEYYVHQALNQRYRLMMLKLDEVKILTGFSLHNPV